ncbi:PREDICTED: coiled-coil domain-containing protein 23 [Chaetura pelagica]|uniref:coiled-coil domain-containing protein 23 n=1 Tax=Chaetura pelagica TaxID=8897 RepID=UPI000523579E|nr:PREDICTED: coiled-coil domain-containing protein 23 [Chaetura pelagica]
MPWCWCALVCHALMCHALVLVCHAMLCHAVPGCIYALNRVMTELEQQQFDSFCKQMQGSGE